MSSVKQSERARIVARLFKLYGAKCFFCQEPLTKTDATIDHFVPKSKGGADHISNFRPSCFGCNNDKADRIPNPDGSLPPKRTSRKSRAIPKAKRPEVCTECASGRLLLEGEVCDVCSSGPMPPIRPHYLKRRTWQCDHEHFWCLSCCLLTDTERVVLRSSMNAKVLEVAGNAGEAAGELVNDTDQRGMGLQTT